MMTQLDSYVRACVPEPFTILGVRLKPFCLGHYFLMQRFDCAFATDSSETDGGILDLLLGIAICSRTYEGFLAFIEDESEFNTWMKKWSAHIQEKIKHDKTFVFCHKIIAFQEYMRDGINVPNFFEEEQKGEVKFSGAHWSQSVLLVLTSELGYSHTEAVNMPLSKALFDYFKWSEKNGSITLMSDEELAAIEAANKETELKEASNGNQ